MKRIRSDEGLVDGQISRGMPYKITGIYGPRRLEKFPGNGRLKFEENNKEIIKNVELRRRERILDEAEAWGRLDDERLRAEIQKRYQKGGLFLTKRVCSSMWKNRQKRISTL